VEEAEHRHAVLVVEDDPTIRRVLRELLTAHGCDVIVAADAAEASAHLSSDRQPCILFVDTIVPAADARSLAQRLALRPVHERVPVVAITTSREDEGIRLLGAVDCLEKPFAFGRLLNVVARHCARAVRQRVT
jgi:CheY-like chemotaxis protein